MVSIFNLTRCDMISIMNSLMDSSENRAPPLSWDFIMETVILHSIVCTIYLELVSELNNYLSKFNCVSILKKCV